MYKNRLLNRYLEWHRKYTKKEAEFQKKLREEVITILKEKFDGKLEMSEWLNDDNWENGASISLTDKHGWKESATINHIFLSSMDKEKEKIQFDVSSEANWGSIDENYADDLYWDDILRTLLIILEDIDEEECKFDKKDHSIKILYDED